QASGRTFIDTDQLMRQRFGRPVAEIFRIYGEPAYRDHETDLLRNLEPGDFVLATGGGVVLRDDNWDQLRRLGVSVYLKASAEVLAKNLERSRSRRPLLDRPDWREHLGNLLSQRRAAYEKADYTIPVDSLSIDEAGNQALARFREAEA
ncbi:MAG: shikimate kinase, partial [Fimbriimonas ginsengisoli]|nr:shikimate kinase [Fimbriimonas ginsengisoli]